MGIVGLVCWRTVEDGLSIFSTAFVMWRSDGVGCIGKWGLGVRLVRAVLTTMESSWEQDELPTIVNIMHIAYS